MCSKQLKRRVIRLCDLGRGFLAAQRDSIEEIGDFRKSDAFAGRSEQWECIFETLSGEIQENITRMEGYLKALSEEYPETFRQAITRRATRMLLCNERRTIKVLSDDGILPEKDASQLEIDLERRSEGL